MLIAGEVHTGLLRGPDPVTADQARRLVDLVVGEPVLVSERPIAYVRSPETPVGVDCGVGDGESTRQVRGVGTALQRAAITGGHVVQGSAYATFVRADGSARQPWSYYLTRPGVIETLSRTRWEEVAAALAAPDRPGASLDLGAIAGRAADRVQRSMSRSGPVRLRAPRTRLRWIAQVDDSGTGTTQVAFTVRSGDLRMLRLALPPALAAIPTGQTGEQARQAAERAGEAQARLARELAVVCEDVAAHDWLLSALLEVVRKSAIGMIPRGEALARLLPAIDYLLHLWMPGARGDAITSEVWAALDRRPGFGRQWDTLVHRIRDQLSVGAVAGLAAAGMQ
jgi:hypothetical protein